MRPAGASPAPGPRDPARERRGQLGRRYRHGARPVAGRTRRDGPRRPPRCPWSASPGRRSAPRRRARRTGRARRSPSRATAATTPPPRCAKSKTAQPVTHQVGPADRGARVAERKLRAGQSAGRRGPARRSPAPAGAGARRVARRRAPASGGEPLQRRVGGQQPGRVLAGGPTAQRGDAAQAEQRLPTARSAGTTPISSMPASGSRTGARSSRDSPARPADAAVQRRVGRRAPSAARSPAPPSCTPAPTRSTYSRSGGVSRAVARRRGPARASGSVRDRPRPVPPDRRPGRSRTRPAAAAARPARSVGRPCSSLERRARRAYACTKPGPASPTGTTRRRAPASRRRSPHRLGARSAPPSASVATRTAHRASSQPAAAGSRGGQRHEQVGENVMDLTNLTR